MNFDSFVANMNGLLGGRAGDKGYTQGGPDGDNKLYAFVRDHVGGNVHAHALGEIIYKAVRYARKGNIEDVQKIAAWAFLIARHHEDAKAATAKQT